MSQSFEERLREEFNKEFTYGVIYSASSDLSGGEGISFKNPNLHPDTVSKWWLSKLSEYKQSLKEEIEGMKEIEYFEKSRGYNQCIEDILKLIN